MLLERLYEIQEKFRDIEKRLSQPDIVRKQDEYVRLNKERSALEPLVSLIGIYKDVLANIDEAEKMLHSSDEEMRELAEEELGSSRGRAEELEQEIKLLLLPGDPNDDKNIIVEIRAGTGGDEAALFAGDLYGMYTRYAEKNGWKYEIIDASPTGLGGYKEIIFMVRGEKVYSRLKFESGGHRVQRVPETESGGRIHTSAATVAVLPEAEEVEVEVDSGDIIVDVYRASGAGGQHVNTTESAVRITHKPTGLVVMCQDEKSQHKNRAKAMKVLLARLYDLKLREQEDEVSSTRRTLVGSGDRSERIRTYNFPQNRVTDHRINYTTYHLQEILHGDLDEIIDKIITEEQARKLEEADL
ncbi:MAG TPA: peptide chain release factor 1 [Candidatus Mcinerneyibacteriales bacterium]|nr:peptide chain release factor 1 [Candidatus Mcinerneyibacteriales bacterium]HPE20745.1 peptide chain release factor 1 [Candidatus Mcinerneyibacteriales bacterium]HPJ69963.1 peptide chain release factor 1 [Candidatus Mcinerneyibacteriales bacterium]